MSKTKAQVQTLAKDISRIVLNTTSLPVYYDDILEELARGGVSPFIAVSQKNVTSGTSIVDLAATEYNPIAFFCIVDGTTTYTHLTKETRKGLEAYSQTWLTDTGDPWAYTEELSSDGNVHSIRLYPEPDATNNSGLVVVSMQDEETNCPDYLAVYIALRILAKEFARPGILQDRETSEAFLAAAKLFWAASSMPSTVALREKLV
jgi:hypothetical protein